MKRLAMGGLVLVALASGCTGGTDEPKDPPVLRPIKAGDTYIALGDSYTAGPQLGPRSGPPGCAQTTGNYPHRLAKELDLELTDVSCGGAATANLTTPQNLSGGTSVDPQLDAVTGDADLVTLGIGGNDGRVFNTLVTTCVGLAVKDPDGSPCTDLARQPGNPVIQMLEDLGDSIKGAVDDIRARAPEARVVVVGYPKFFPDEQLCDRVPLAAGDLGIANEVTAKLRDALRDGARRADAEFVDVQAATEGHDICSDDPWVAGAVPERPALAFHPYAEEQQEVARLLKELVAS